MKKLKNILLGAAAIIVGIVLVILAFALPNAASSKESKVLKSYITCLNKGEISKAYNKTIAAATNPYAGSFKTTAGEAIKESLFYSITDDLEAEDIVSVKLIGCSKPESDNEGGNMFTASYSEATALIEVTYLDSEGKKATRVSSVSVYFQNQGKTSYIYYY